jgi:uncharacterized protein
MTVDARLLDILCCPVTKVPVRKLSADKLRAINEQVAAGAARFLDGDAISDPLLEALVTQNGTTVYRVDDGIPIMLEERGIPTSQFDAF